MRSSIYTVVSTHTVHGGETRYFSLLFIPGWMIIDYNADRKKESDNLLHFYQKENAGGLNKVT